MPRRLSTKGFSVVGMLVVLLVVVAFSLSGFFVWQKSKSDEAASKSDSTTSQNSQNNNKTTDPSENGKYIVIKEWGIRFILPEEFRGDVKYGIFTLNNGDQAAYFASKKIAARSPGGPCDLVPENETSGRGVSGGTIAVGRSKVKLEETEGRNFSHADYWYTLDYGNIACYEGDTGQERGRFNTTMDDAIRQLESIEQ